MGQILLPENWPDLEGELSGRRGNSAGSANGLCTSSFLSCPVLFQLRSGLSHSQRSTFIEGRHVTQLWGSLLRAPPTPPPGL